MGGRQVIAVAIGIYLPILAFFLFAFNAQQKDAKAITSRRMEHTLRNQRKESDESL